MLIAPISFKVHLVLFFYLHLGLHEGLLPVGLPAFFTSNKIQAFGYYDFLQIFKYHF